MPEIKRGFDRGSRHIGDFNRPRKLRIFTINANTGKPVAGLPLTISLVLFDESSKDPHEISAAVAQTDRVGYATVELNKLVNDPRLTHVWVSTTGKIKTRQDALPILKTKVEPAIVTLSVTDEAQPGMFQRFWRSNVGPDVHDINTSPDSFVNEAPVALIGESCCEELLHSRAATQKYRFVQIVRDEAGPKPLLTTPQAGDDAARLETGPFTHEHPSRMRSASPPYAYRLSALLEYEVTWRPVGHALGKLIYSLPLAPCESTNVAIIDWARQDRTRRDEDTRFSEQLQHSQHRERDIEEIVNASLKETQEGGSFMHGLGAAIGINLSFIDIGGNSATGGAYSGSKGERTLSSETSQRVLDTFVQQSSAMRKYNSTVVVQASQAEQEHIQTRTITNHNHCHAMTVLYYETVIHYKVSVQLKSKRDALLIKYTNINDFGQEPIATPSPDGELPLADPTRFNRTIALHYRRVIEPILLEPTLKRCFPALAKWYCVAQGRARPRADSSSGRNSEVETIEGVFSTGDVGIAYVSRGRFGGGAETHPVRAYIVTKDEPENRIPLRTVERYYWTPLTGVGANVLPRTELGGYSEGMIPDSPGPAPGERAFSANKEDLITLEPTERVLWDNVAAIELSCDTAWGLQHIRLSTGSDGNEWTMVDADVSHSFEHDPVYRANVQAIGSASPSFSGLGPLEECCVDALVSHLNQNRMYYARAIWLSQDREERAAALERYFITLEGDDGVKRTRPVIDFIENRVAAVSGDYIAFPLGTTRVASQIDTDSENEVAEEVIVLPTRGVFAEAKLSHCNACEERDETRRWDWSKSPCPKPPEIAPIQAGQHEVQETPSGEPSAMPSPVVNIVNPPSAPDPTGMVGALSLLATPEIFRNMSMSKELGSLLEELAAGAVTMAQAQSRARSIIGGDSDGPAARAHDRRVVNDRAIKEGLKSGALTEDEAKALQKENIENMVRGDEGDGSGGVTHLDFEDDHVVEGDSDRVSHVEFEDDDVVTADSGGTSDSDTVPASETSPEDALDELGGGATGGPPQSLIMQVFGFLDAVRETLGTALTLVEIMGVGAAGTASAALGTAGAIAAVPLGLYSIGEAGQMAYRIAYLQGYALALVDVSQGVDPNTRGWSATLGSGQTWESTGRADAIRYLNRMGAEEYAPMFIVLHEAYPSPQARLDAIWNALIQRLSSGDRLHAEALGPSY